MLTTTGAIMIRVKGCSNARLIQREIEEHGRLCGICWKKHAEHIYRYQYWLGCFAPQEEYMRLLNAVTAYGCPSICHIRGRLASGICVGSSDRCS